MNILLINIDSTIPNVALKKIELYHKQRGDKIVWDMPLFSDWADKIYVSCVFDWNRDKCKQWENMAHKEQIGGTGYDLYVKLPPEIEQMKPKINYGFTTRGCIRNCPFCVVPRTEGKIRAVGDIYDFWDGKSKELFIMDNNILALPQHFMKIADQIIKEKLVVDFNQGLDHRLLTNEICQKLFKIKHKYEIRLAFDDIRYYPTVKKAMAILRNNGLKDWGTRWYVFSGLRDNFATTYERLIYLKNNKQLGYVMRDRRIYDNKEITALAVWSHLPSTFKMDFKEFISVVPRGKIYYPYIKKYWDIL